MLTFGEKIKVMAKRKGITMSQLAEMTDQTKQNLTNKFKRDNFTESEMMKFCTALGCECTITITDSESGEMI